MHLTDMSVTFKTVSDNIFLSMKDVLHALDLEKIVRKRGYGFMDNPLKIAAVNASSLFLYSGKHRTFVHAAALLSLINDGILKKSEGFKEGLMSLLLKEASVSASIKKQIDTPRRKPFQEHMSVNSSPRSKDKVKAKRPLFKASGKKKTKQGTALIKTKMLDMLHKDFKGDSELFYQSFSKLFVRSGKKEFNGSIPIPALVNMLSTRPDQKSKSGNTLLSNLVVQSAPQVYNLSPLEVIQYSDNFSGVRLTEKYRQRLPGVFPSARNERLAKQQSKEMFAAVFLPRRTPSGWKIDVSRLLQVLEMRYYLVSAPFQWKIHGDARMIADEHSTVISLSILNNEAVAHGISFQSCEEVHPVHIFYGSDCRDNLETNLQHTNQALKDMSSNHNFFLGGDEMFLEGILDGSNVLSPTSEDGWNIYSKCNKKSKEERSADGLRTNLQKKIDREHPESLFDLVSTDNVVMCILHAITRCTEKLLSLEVLNILSEANKMNERSSGQGDFFRQSAVGNLEANLCRKGVRKGNFRILFNKNGSPEPISLNKDCALLVLHPETDNYQHALRNVCRRDRTIKVNLPTAIRRTLNLGDSYVEEEFVILLWTSFWKMVCILRKDAMPASSGKIPTLEEIGNHSWGYAEADVSEYRHQAEIFYQLFCLRHGAASLTPYMIKLIDHAPQLMTKLPFPLARYMSEGAEHLNYYDSKFFHRKTTRNGGKYRADTMLASMHHRWCNLYYHVSEYANSDNQDRHQVGINFVSLCRQHLSATVIQKNYRGYRVRKKLADLGWTSYSAAGEMVKTEVLKEFSTRQPTEVSDKPLRGMSFVLTGTFPSSKGKTITHASLKKTIRENGGAVRDAIPYRSKSVSEKKYIVISSDKCLQQKKIPGVLHHAVRRSFAVTTPAYIFDCIQQSRKLAMKDYGLDLSQLQSKITRDISVAKRYFSRAAGTLKSVMKANRRKHTSKYLKEKKPPKYLNPSVFFVAQKLRACPKEKSLLERRKLFAKHLEEWKQLSSSQKDEVRLAWRRFSHK